MIDLAETDINGVSIFVCSIWIVSGMVVVGGGGIHSFLGLFGFSVFWNKLSAFIIVFWKTLLGQ